MQFLRYKLRNGGKRSQTFLGGLVYEGGHPIDLARVISCETFKFWGVDAAAGRRVNQDSH